MFLFAKDHQFYLALKKVRQMVEFRHRHFIAGRMGGANRVTDRRLSNLRAFESTPPKIPLSTISRPSVTYILRACTIEPNPQVDSEPS